MYFIDTAQTLKRFTCCNILYNNIIMYATYADSMSINTDYFIWIIITNNCNRTTLSMLANTVRSTIYGMGRQLLEVVPLVERSHCTCGTREKAGKRSHKTQVNYLSSDLCLIIVLRTVRELRSKIS